MKKKIKLDVTFHNPNTDETTAKVLMKILAESIVKIAMEKDLLNDTIENAIPN